MSQPRHKKTRVVVALKSKGISGDTTVCDLTFSNMTVPEIETEIEKAVHDWWFEEAYNPDLATFCYADLAADLDYTITWSHPR